MPNNESPKSTERLLAILDALADSPERGLRLTDLVDVTGLGKTTAHRLINGLVENGLVEQNADTSRYFVGLKLLKWAGAASKRFTIQRLAEPALARIADATRDTVYLIAKAGDHAVCVDCFEATYPIKVLTLKIGDRRPLGIGAGSLAILSALNDHDVDRVLLKQAPERREFAIGDDMLRKRLAESRELGYAFNDVHVFAHVNEITGMAAVAVPVRKSDGTPVGALHVNSTTERMLEPRRSKVVQILIEEAALLERDLAPLLDGPGYLQRIGL